MKKFNFVIIALAFLVIQGTSVWASEDEEDLASQTQTILHAQQKCIESGGDWAGHICYPRKMINSIDATDGKIASNPSLDYFLVSGEGVEKLDRESLELIAIKYLNLLRMNHQSD
jgi:hypothetical protein